MTSNTSGIIPTEYKVLTLPDKVEEKTKGGLLLPPDAREKEQAAATAGTIIAISPLAFTYAEWPKGSRIPKVGDRVAFARYAGTAVLGVDGQDYRLVNDKDIYGIYSQ